MSKPISSCSDSLPAWNNSAQSAQCLSDSAKSWFSRMNVALLNRNYQVLESMIPIARERGMLPKEIIIGLFQQAMKDLSNQKENILFILNNINIRERKLFTVHVLNHLDWDFLQCLAEIEVDKIEKSGELALLLKTYSKPVITASFWASVIIQLQKITKKKLSIAGIQGVFNRSMQMPGSQTNCFKAFIEFFSAAEILPIIINAVNNKDWEFLNYMTEAMMRVLGKQTPEFLHISPRLFFSAVEFCIYNEIVPSSNFVRFLLSNSLHDESSVVNVGQFSKEELTLALCWAFYKKNSMLNIGPIIENLRSNLPGEKRGDLEADLVLLLCKTALHQKKWDLLEKQLTVREICTALHNVIEKDSSNLLLIDQIIQSLCFEDDDELLEEAKTFAAANGKANIVQKIVERQEQIAALSELFVDD